MAIVNAFDRFKHFAELLSPLVTGEGVLTPLTRRQRCAANLGVSAGVGGPARMAAPAPQTATGAATLSTTQMLGPLLVATPAGGAAYTFPLGSAMETAVQLVANNDFQNDEAWELAIINTAPANAITLTPAANFTIIGDPVIDTDNPQAILRIRRSAPGIFIAYRIG